MARPGPRPGRVLLGKLERLEFRENRRRERSMNRTMFAVAAATALLMTGAARAAADFSFGIEGCPARLSGNPGDPVSFDAFVTLTTANNDGADGAQGWSLSV